MFATFTCPVDRRTYITDGTVVLPAGRESEQVIRDRQATVPPTAEQLAERRRVEAVCAAVRATLLGR